jgi:flavin reductase (DIM6/NTAB) family NADH-FMN oxidoreductase RutF
MTAPNYTKKDFPTHNVRRFLEPGPIILVSSAYKSETNIMTMGWHMIMEFEPSLVGCYIWTENHSFEMIRRSKQCVINIPTEDLALKVVKVGNTSGRDIDKFRGVRLYRRPRHACARAIDPRVLRQFRMQAGRFKPDQEIQPVRIRGDESACRDRAENS